MAPDVQDDDVRAIEAIVARQFASLTWTPARDADWEAFAGDFFPEAALFPAARPVKRQTVGGFLERMEGLQGSALRSFDEVVLGRRSGCSATWPVPWRRARSRRTAPR